MESNKIQQEEIRMGTEWKLRNYRKEDAFQVNSWIKKKTKASGKLNQLHCFNLQCLGKGLILKELCTRNSGQNFDFYTSDVRWRGRHLTKWHSVKQTETPPRVKCNWSSIKCPSQNQGSAIWQKFYVKTPNDIPLCS